MINMSRNTHTSTSFHEILLEKMATHNDENEPSTNSVMNDNLHSVESFSFVEMPISESLRLLKFKTPTLKNGRYPSKPIEKKPIIELVIVQKVEASEPAWPLQQLSTTAQLSLHVLGLVHIANSKDGCIRLSEVKKAYRRLARKLHPDLNPNAKREDFYRAKEATDILIDELTALATKATNGNVYTAKAA
jgi:hypothetical protein